MYYLNRFHHTHVIEWLLDTAHADVSKRTASNGLALHFAVVGGDYDAVKLLLDEDPRYPLSFNWNKCEKQTGILFSFP